MSSNDQIVMEKASTRSVAGRGGDPFALTRGVGDVSVEQERRTALVGMVKKQFTRARIAVRNELFLS